MLRLSVFSFIIFILLQMAHPTEDIYDAFLQDDYTTSTQNFISSDNFTQVHNFWKHGDVDWALFNADIHKSYDINITNQAAHCDAALYLYHESNLAAPLLILDDWHQPINENEVVSWDSGSTSGTMFVKVTQSPLSPGWAEGETTYTLTIFSAWGPSTGLATITGTCATIGPPGGVLQAGPGGLYTQPRLEIPAGALNSFVEFLLEDPGDIGSDPYFDYTRQWLNAHPGNASIVRVYSQTPVEFNIPATLTLQFIDDGPTVGGFTLDDVPEGAQITDMWIYEWNGAEWKPGPEPQSVSSEQKSTGKFVISDYNTVSMQIMKIDNSVFAAAPYAISRVAGWMLY